MNFLLVAVILAVAVGLFAIAVMLRRFARVFEEKRSDEPMVPEDPRITWRTTRLMRGDLKGMLEGVDTEHILPHAWARDVEVFDAGKEKLVRMVFACADLTVRFDNIPAPIAKQLLDGLHARLSPVGLPAAEPVATGPSPERPIDLGQLGTFAITGDWTLYARSMSDYRVAAVLDLGIHGAYDLRDKLAATVGKLTIAELRSGIVKVAMPQRQDRVMIPAKQAEHFYATHKRA